MARMSQRNEYFQRVLRLIDKHGWMAQGVGAEDDQPAYTYTVGMYRRQHPEFILVGLPFDVSHRLLTILADRVMAGDRFVAGNLVHEVAVGYPVALLEVSPAESARMLRLACTVQQLPTVAALQVVFPDQDQRWPWEPDSRVTTPLLGPIPDMR